MNIIGGFLFGFGASGLVQRLIKTYRGREKGKLLTRDELNPLLVYTGVTLIGIVFLVIAFS